MKNLPNVVRRPISRIGRRFAATLVLLVAAFVILAGIPSFLIIQNHMRDDIELLLKNQAEIFAQRVENNIDGAYRIINSMARNPLVGNALVDSQGRDLYLVPFLKQFQGSIGGSIAMALVDHKGKIIAQEGGRALGWVTTAGWISTVMDSLEPGVRFYPERGVLIIAVPVIYLPTGSAEGMIIGEIVLSDLLKAATSNIQQGEAVWIGGRGGAILASVGYVPEREYLSRGHALSVRASGARIDMELTSGILTDVALRPLASFYAIYAVFSLLFTVLISLVALFLSSRLVQPIVELSDIAKDVAAGGNLYAQLPTHRKDELGDLARAFSDMLHALNEGRQVLEDRVAERTKELLQAKLMAEDANRTKSEFLSIVSHELRTPLTSINGALGLLNSGRMGELPDKARNLLAIAGSNSARLIRIVNDILDFQKIEAGRMELAPARIDLCDVVAKAVEASRSYGEQFGVKLVLKRETAKVFVDADHDRIIQVVTNLLSNAAKFSKPGSHVDIHVGEHDRLARTEIRDYGAGIPEAFKVRIFERFAQADSSSTRKVSGTGLGLSICKEIVELHHGELTFESEEGRGSTFRFDLPLAAELA